MSLRISRVFRMLLFPLLSLPLLAACAGANHGEVLADALYAGCKAECNFTLTAKDTTVEGVMHIEKGDRLTVDILEPQPYTGIRVETDCSGNNELFGIDYDGVSVTVPKDMLFRFGLLCAPFEDGFAAKIEALPPDAFEEYGEEGDYSVSFPYGDGSGSVVFDGRSGIPKTTEIHAGGTTVRLSVLRFERMENSTEQYK